MTHVGTAAGVSSASPQPHPAADQVDMSQTLSGAWALPGSDASAFQRAGRTVRLSRNL